MRKQSSRKLLEALVIPDSTSAILLVQVWFYWSKPGFTGPNSSWPGTPHPWEVSLWSNKQFKKKVQKYFLTTIHTHRKTSHHISLNPQNWVGDTNTQQPSDLDHYTEKLLCQRNISLLQTSQVTVNLYTAVCQHKTQRLSDSILHKSTQSTDLLLFFFLLFFLFSTDVVSVHRPMVLVIEMLSAVPLKISVNQLSIPYKISVNQSSILYKVSVNQSPIPLKIPVNQSSIS